MLYFQPQVSIYKNKEFKTFHNQSVLFIKFLTILTEIWQVKSVFNKVIYL